LNRQDALRQWVFPSFSLYRLVASQDFGYDSAVVDGVDYATPKVIELFEEFEKHLKDQTLTKEYFDTYVRALDNVITDNVFEPVVNNLVYGNDVVKGQMVIAVLGGYFDIVEVLEEIQELVGQLP